MSTNLEKFKKDLKKLTSKGLLLQVAMEHECYPEQVKQLYGKNEKGKELLKSLPSFASEYQSWYSEATVVIKQLLPDRLEDFVGHYRKPKPRKDITYENYRVEDYLQGLNITRGWEKQKVVGPDAAIPQFRQQLAILQAADSRFESALFDIRQLLQADLLDSELDEARELLKRGFVRASGAIAGVVLEKHLTQVAQNHSVTMRKKNPGISDFNELLKSAEVVDTPTWRQIQRLGDIRNLCDHNKDREPTKTETEELIDGVGKYTKTLF
jgi:hypothetical protein